MFVLVQTTDNDRGQRNNTMTTEVDEESSALWVWAVLLFSCAYQPFAIVWFWKRSSIEPICLRRPDMAIVGNIASCGWCLAMGLHYSFLYYKIPPPLVAIVVFSFQSLVLDSYFVLALNLYVAYNHQIRLLKLNTTMMVTSNGEKVPAHLRSSLRWASLSKFLLSKRFVVGFLSASVLIVVIAEVIWTAMHPYMMQVGIEEDDNTARLVDIGVYKTLFSGICIIVISFRLTLVDDAFGTKKALKRIAVGPFLGFGLYIAFSSSLRSLVHSRYNLDAMVTFLAMQYVFICGTVLPILESYRHGGRKPMMAASVADERFHEFEMFIRTEKGFAAFRDHLVRECAVESLLFWKDAADFVDKFGHLRYLNSEDIVSMRERAGYIFQRYLANDALLELNLPAEMFKRFRNEIFAADHDENHHHPTEPTNRTPNPNSVSPLSDAYPLVLDTIHAHVFDEAINCVLCLMQQDSLRRFKSDQRYAKQYQEFVVQYRLRDKSRTATAGNDSIISRTT